MTSQSNNITIVNSSDANAKDLYAPIKNAEGKVSNYLMFKIPQGHLLTPHWHPNSNEITVCRGGEGKVVIISPNKANPGLPFDPQIESYNLKENDAVFLKQGYFHFFINIGETDFNIELSFEEGDPDIISSVEILNNIPANINIAIQPNKLTTSSPLIPYIKMPATPA